MTLTKLRASIVALGFAFIGIAGVEAQTGGYIYPAATAVMRTINARLSDTMSIRDFGATCSGAAVTTQVQNAVTAAAAAKRTLEIPACLATEASTSYLIGATITLPSNTDIDGNGELKLADGVDDHLLRVASSATVVSVKNIWLDGNRDNNTGGNCISGGTNASSIKIKDVKTHHCSNNGVNFSSSGMTDIEIDSVRSYNNGNRGVAVLDGVSRYTITKSWTYDNDVGGYNLDASLNGLVDGNTSYHDGHGSGSVSDGFSGYNQATSDILLVNNRVFDSGNHCYHLGGDDIEYKNNFADGCAARGIIHENDGGGATTANRITISGNNIKNATLDGIRGSNIATFRAKDNVVTLSGAYGLTALNTPSAVVVGNELAGNTSGTINTGGATTFAQRYGNTDDTSSIGLFVGSARSVLGVAGNSSTDVAAIQGSTDQILRVTGAGTGLGFGSIDLSKSAAVGSSILPLANGGSGSSTARGAAAAFKAPHILCASAVQSSITGSTSETALATCTIPANALGANGGIRVSTIWSNNSSANNKTKRIRLGGTGGTAYFQSADTTLITARDMRSIWNRNATNTQVGGASSATAFGATSGALVTSSIDTTAAVDIVISGQLADGGDNMALEAYQVELLRP